jgi:hypothetical protein
MSGMHRENTGIFAEFEVSDLAFLCTTGAGFAHGIQYQICREDYAWDDEDEIGRIDAPDFMPGGGCKFENTTLTYGISPIVVSRE